MNEQTLHSCEQLMQNRLAVKSVFAWDGALMHMACAGIFSTKGLDVETVKLKYCKDLVKHRLGAFSNFKGNARSAVAALLSTSDNPDELLERAIQIYGLLKKKFWTSDFLPLVAMMIAQMVEPEQYEAIVERTRVIYDRMKKEHPFLTSREDSAFCALMAISDKSDDQLISDCEECYRSLKNNFFSSNAVQSLSHVLALCEGDNSYKCKRTMELFDKLKMAGYKYGTSYELPTLGILAMTDVSLEEIVSQMTEIDNWLARQKGFGFFSSITKKQRLMYAGILAQKNYMSTQTMQTAAVTGTISLVVAQQAAICAAVAASSAADASSASS